MAKPINTVISKRTLLKGFLGIATVAAASPVFMHIRGKRKLSILHTRIAGFAYYQGRALAEKLHAGKPLQLQREPTNSHDSNAIKVLYKNQQLGYVPRNNNKALNQLIASGETLQARIVAMDKHKPYEPLTFEVLLWV